MNKWKSLIEHEDHLLEICNLKIHIKKGVFTPDNKLTFSTEFLLQNIPEVKNKKILDLGCGTGIIGIYCLSKGAEKVTFSDVNKKALENTKLNLKENNFSSKFEIIESNVFENINEKFDIIFANLPIKEDLWEGKSPIKIIEEFILNYKKYLNQNGLAYFVWADFGDINKLNNEIIEKYDLPLKLKTKKMLESKWWLFELN